MSHHERETCARKQRAATTLIEIVDEIHKSRHLIDAAFMAAVDLPQDQQGAMRALLDLISDRLTAAAINLEAYAQVAPDAA